MRLNTQVSEYDCALTSLLNAFKILYKKDEIPIEIIKIIYKNILDSKNKIIGDCGTSKNAMKKVLKKINKYNFKSGFNLNINYLSNTECNINKIYDCIYDNGVVIIRSVLELDHYYLITNIDDNHVYIWDPYLEIETNNMYNLKLEIKTIDNEKEIAYSLGPLDNREIILLTKDC